MAARKLGAGRTGCRVARPDAPMRRMRWWGPARQHRFALSFVLLIAVIISNAASPNTALALVGPPGHVSAVGAIQIDSGAPPDLRSDALTSRQVAHLFPEGVAA